MLNKCLLNVFHIHAECFFFFKKDAKRFIDAFDTGAAFLFLDGDVASAAFLFSTTTLGLTSAGVSAFLDEGHVVEASSNFAFDGVSIIAAVVELSFFAFTVVAFFLVLVGAEVGGFAEVPFGLFDFLVIGAVEYSAFVFAFNVFLFLVGVET
jgi:hypothetical protein